MIYISTIYCSACKKTGVPLVKHNKTIRKKRICQYHQCRDCNNIRRKKYYKNNTEKCRKILNRSIKKNAHKQAARLLLNKAVISGQVLKPKKCEVCGVSAERVEGHHTDYTQPLKVVWCCPGCHSQQHKKMV